MIHFIAVYEKTPTSLAPYVRWESKIASLEEQLLQKDFNLSELKSNLTKTLNRLNTQTDKRHSNREFEIGDAIYLKLQPYRQHSLAKRGLEKLSSRIFVPLQDYKEN